MEALKDWFAPIGLLLLATLGGILARAVLRRRVKRAAARTRTRLDDLLVDAVERYVPLWFVLAGLAAAVPASPLAARYEGLIKPYVVKAGLLITVTLAAARFGSRGVALYAPRFSTSAVATSMAGNLVRVGVIAMGALLLLANLDVQITPILTALGVGSLAVALALQDTLSNLFAGMHIVASRMLEVGDYIRLDSGQEGFVVDVGWRFTRLREAPDNEIVIPNAKLSQAIVVNYQKPAPEGNVIVPMGVAYGSDLAKVEKVTLEVASEVQRAAGVAAFQPAVRFQAFGDSAIQFAVVLRTRSFPERAALVHEFVKRVHERYRQEGIEIPFPQRVVTMQSARS